MAAIQVLEQLKKGFLFLDGALGTMLQNSGLPVGERPECFCLTHPDVLGDIHRAYAQAGAQVLCTNTFGANARKLEGSSLTPEEAIAAAVRCARTGGADTDCAVALDIGPIGEMLEPAGTLAFEEAYALFAQQVRAGVAAGVDLVMIETMTDLYEMKAAVLAVRENCSLPLFATMTFEASGHTFTGCSPSALALTLEGLGVDAMGINCSLEPAQMIPIAREIGQWTQLPLIVKANAGLPDPQTGAYDVSPAQFAADVARLGDIGVQAVGGCCGTTPAYIREIRRVLAGRTPAPRIYKAVSAVCTPTHTVVLDGVRVIGERINPTGKKRLKQALMDGDMGYILEQGIAQIEAGADILDVNVGLPGIDERDKMCEVVRALQSVCDAPLQLDSSDPCVLEAALRAYNGKAIINSVNGEDKVLAQILPLVKKYGAAVVGLTLDEKGIPDSAQERLAIASHILNAALSYGIRREDVYIDCLTLTVSAQPEGAETTLEAVQMIKECLGLHTVLGVSNISFGLPNRELINHSFLTLALGHGLCLPILNPNVSVMMDAIAAYNVLLNRDAGAGRFIARFAQTSATSPISPVQEHSIAHAIATGLCVQSKNIAKTLLQTRDALEVVEKELIPALDRVGERFEKGEIFLPQLLQSAQAAQAAFDAIREKMEEAGGTAPEGEKIVIATVKGDIHDIGKNIAKVILRNYGYQVLDLGRDVSAEKVVEAVLKYHVRLVGLSALMTTTLRSMEETIRALHEAAPECTVFVAGAVLTPEYAAQIGAHAYAKDAKAAVDIAKRVLG